MDAYHKEDTSFESSMKKLLSERLAAKKWSRYRLAKEIGSIREQKKQEDIKATKYTTVVNKCLDDPSSVRVVTLLEVAAALNIGLKGIVTEYREVQLT